MKFVCRFREVLVLATLAFACSAGAQVPNLKGEYSTLNPPHAVQSGQRIEVIEFFYYGCPVCYELQPHISRWLLGAPNYVALRYVPALSAEGWDTFAKLYYSLEALGQVQRLHWPVYDNFHFDGVQLNQEKVMFDWVERNGIPRDKFMAVYNSQDVKDRVEDARQLMKSYDVRGVPTIVVDGKYMSSARTAGGTRQLMQVVDGLVRQARKERPVGQ